MGAKTIMRKFLETHGSAIHGVLECFDRILVKGHLPISSPGGMANLMRSLGVPLSNFKNFVSSKSDEIKKHAQEVAEKAGRPFIPFKKKMDKDAEAKLILSKQGHAPDGLICVFTAVEACNSFRLCCCGGKPLQLVNENRKCLCVYFYIMDEEFGLIHIRIQTWFPFTIQICLNGHEWLARRMDAEGLEYQKDDNCFIWLSDPTRAQALADEFTSVGIPKRLSVLARKVNPFFESLLAGLSYYWGDGSGGIRHGRHFRVRGGSRRSVPRLCSTTPSSALTPRTSSRFSVGNSRGISRAKRGAVREAQAGQPRQALGGEELDQDVPEDSRLPRVETVINNPRDFKILRQGTRDGVGMVGWFVMSKDVRNLPRYAEISKAANGRYFDALACQSNPRPAIEDMRRIAATVRVNGRGYGGFNPASVADIELFRVIMWGGNTLRGFKNKEISRALYGTTACPAEKRRRSYRVTRILKRLHLRGLIKKAARTRLWRVTHDGWRIMGTTVSFYKEHYPQSLERKVS